jgi:hypothetical protein
MISLAWTQGQTQVGRMSILHLEPILPTDLRLALALERLALRARTPIKPPRPTTIEASICVRCGDVAAIDLDPPTSLCGRCRRELTPAHET